MFNTLFSIFKNISHMSSLIQSLEDLLSHFSADYIKDQNARDAAIDAIIEILQSHKSGKPNA